MKTEGWLSRVTETAPGRIALVAGDERLTYGELDERASAAALHLVSGGVTGGDTVALAMEPSAGYVVLVHALIKLGAIAAPLDPRLGQAELEPLLASLRPKLVVSDAQQALDAPASPAGLVDEMETDTKAVQCVIHTSGSAGRPKPVELTYGNQLWSAIGSGMRIGVAPGDVWLCCLPLHHIGGLAIVLRSALYGTAVLLERFDPGRVAERIASQPVTLASLVPTMLARLLDAGADLRRLRCVLLGGGPAPRALLERALDAGVPVAPTYGLTEAASQVATLPPGEAATRPGSAGPPIFGTELRIADDGRILVRGPTVAPGELGEDGWLRTGDLGRLDRDGYLEVLGRADDVILSGGENVSPQEVEDVLLDHPAVADAAVTGREDAEWQHAVVAFVVRVADTSVGEAELRAFCRERLAGYKAPKAIEFVAELPRDPQGKLRRREVMGGG